MDLPIPALRRLRTMVIVAMSVGLVLVAGQALAASVAAPSHGTSPRILDADRPVPVARVAGAGRALTNGPAIAAYQLGTALGRHLDLRPRAARTHSAKRVRRRAIHTRIAHVRLRKDRRTAASSGGKSTHGGSKRVR